MVKSNTQLLIENPKLLARFCELLVQRATVTGIEIEVVKISESLRTQLSAARACDLDTTRLLKYCRAKKHDRLLVFAHAVGQERGQRLGRERGQQLLEEARMFAELQVARLVPFLGDVEPIADD